MYGQGKSKKRHVEGDTMWIYKSKAEMIEERGIGKVGGNEYREHKDELEGRIDEIQIYGEKFYLDVESCKHYLGINGVEKEKVAKSCNKILGTNTLEEHHLYINGVSQEEYDKVVAELEQYKEANSAYRDKIQEYKTSANEDKINIEYWERKFRDCEKELNDYRFRKKGATWSWIRKKFRIGEDQYDAFSEEWENNV